jgi:hypothetical protein
MMGCIIFQQRNLDNNYLLSDASDAYDTDVPGPVININKEEIKKIKTS